MTSSEYRDYHKIAQRKTRRTPGTYVYNAAHGIGLPGLKRYIRERTNDLLKQREAMALRLKETNSLIELLEKKLNGNG